jgi:hypothetical protein
MFSMLAAPVINWRCAASGRSMSANDHSLAEDAAVRSLTAIRQPLDLDGWAGWRVGKVSGCGAALCSSAGRHTHASRRLHSFAASPSVNRSLVTRQIRLQI